VAGVLQDTVREEETRHEVTNLYLCPLATKPQALGFALYYVFERRGTATSVIFPFAESYSRETTTGLSRVWKYTVELPPQLGEPAGMAATIGSLSGTNTVPM